MSGTEVGLCVRTGVLSLARQVSLSALMVACWGLSPGAAVAQTGASVGPGAGQSGQVEEIVVTSQKREQNIKDVPLSISALSGADLAEHHILGYEDITRTVPSVSFAAGGGGFGVGEGEMNIEIRGISSTSGSATTGLYLNDTSITVNQDSQVGAVQPLPVDLARVEVLRGPQGTLYGASSEGGTIRFIQNLPKLDVYEGTLSADLSGTYKGGVNYFGSGVLNLPIVSGKLALRANIAYGDDSGWIDNYSLSGNLQKTGVNSERHELLRLAAIVKPNDDLTILPDVFFQRNQQSDAPVSDIQDPAYAAANSFTIPTPVPSDGLYRQHNEVTESIRDTLFTSGLNVQYATDYGEFTSVSSFVYRNFDRVSDSTDYGSFYLANLLNEYTPNPKVLSVIGTIPGPQIQPAIFKTLSQEVRFNAHTFEVLDMPVHAVGGLYYSYQYELDRLTAVNPGISQAFQSIYGYGINSPQSPISDPDIPTWFANDLLAQERARQTYAQYAGFGQVDVDILPTLHFSAGLRYLYARVASTVDNTPHIFGSPGPNGSNYTFENQNNYAATPKFSLTYDVTPEVNVYTTIAKGYRLGGSDTLPPPIGSSSPCNPDYKFLGISAPDAKFGPDHVWSYELGSKARLLDNTLSVDAAGYDIEWSNIQQTVVLPFCGYPYGLNVGNARSYGGEIQVAYKPDFVPGFTFGLNGNISHATILSTVSPTVVQVGQDVLFVPQYSLTFSGEYRRPINDEVTAFIRADYDMTGRSHGSFFAGNPGDVNRPYGVLNGSMGFETDDLQVNLYAKNLANDHTFIQTPAINLLVTGYTVRPLTVGVSVTKHFSGSTEEPEAAAAYVPPPVVAPTPAPKSYLVFFDFNKSDLTPQATEIVDTAAKNAGPAKVTQLTVTGHTDTVGSDAYNMRLSRRRAESVAAELEKDGIASSEIEIVAKGKHDLLVPTKDGVKEPQNRRVQIVYSGSAGS